MSIKTLYTAIAIAISGTLSTAQAQTPTIEIYGKMRMFQESDRVGTAASQTKLTNADSRLGFRGKEDLGNGLQAFFTLETAVNSDAPDAAEGTKMGDRTSLVGLQTGVWRLSSGRSKHAQGLLLDNYDAMDNFLMSSATAVHQGPSSRISNALFATITPTKDVSFNYQHSNADETGTTKATRAGGVDFKLRDFSASVAYFDTGTNNTNRLLGVRYNLPAVRTSLFAIYSDDEKNGIQTQGKSIGVRKSLTGALTLIGSYGENNTLKAHNLGAKYDLSKRTSLHLRYRHDSADVARSDRRQIGLGIDHNF